MKHVLQFLGLLFLVILFVGTGQLLSTQVGRGNLWQMFWLGFIIWLWGYIVLMRVKDKEKMASEERTVKNPFLIKLTEELDKVKVAAISALVAVTFFYFSISVFFRDDLILSSVVLVLTFAVSWQLQNWVLRREKKDEEY